MIINGKIAHGMMRGEHLIDRYYNRLRNVLGFAPFKGTLNIKLDKNIDIKNFELKRLDHVLMSGRSWIDVRLAPAILHFKDKKVDCWIIREEKGVHYKDVIEILTKDNINDMIPIKIGMDVKVELHMVKRPGYEKFREKMKSLVFRTNE